MSEPTQTPKIVNYVLFVDDEPNILSALRRGLIKEDYIKYFALSGHEALEIMAKHEVHVLVTDMRMPGMNGLELLKVVAEKYPNIVKIVLSGYTQLPQVLATINQVDIYKFIPKPWNMEEDFIPMIKDALALYNMTQEYNQLKSALEKQNLFYQKLMRQSEDKFSQLRASYEQLIQFNQEVYAEACRLLNTPNFSTLAPADISAKFEAIEHHLKRFSLTVPVETIRFKAEKLRTDLSQIIQSFLPKEEKPQHTFVGKLERPGSPPTEPAISIMHDGNQDILMGNYKLYLLLQRFILSGLLNFKDKDLITISQIVDTSANTLILQYDCSTALLTSQTWDFQMYLFILTVAHLQLPGKFEMQRIDQVIHIKSTFHYTPNV